jgi:DNA polymerase III epsilon subunit family exonuclease
MTSHDFAVVDVETTGLFPARYDRVIEIAVLRANPAGKVIDEFATLVNPKRDLGPTRIHGITARELVDAPEFAEVAGDVLSLLKGAAFVAHNVRFDLSFIKAEMTRAGVDLPEVPRICTMRLAKAADPDLSGRSLEDVCGYFGIEHDQAHSALDDARAAGLLLARCIARMGLIPEEIIEGTFSGEEAWPNAMPGGRTWRRQDSAARRREEESYIQRLVASLLPGPAPAEISE